MAWETAITPSATSSKILIMFNPFLTVYQSGAASARGTVKVLEKIGAGSYANLSAGTVAFETMVGVYDYGNDGVQNKIRPLFQYLSSPNTTDECKYKLQFVTSGSSVGLFNDAQRGTVILMEVGA